MPSIAAQTEAARHVRARYHAPLALRRLQVNRKIMNIEAAAIKKGIQYFIIASSIIDEFAAYNAIHLSKFFLNSSPGITLTF
jgi:hypothetical protein